MGEGVLATINQTLDREMAQLVASDNGIELKVKIAKTAEDLLEDEFSRRKSGRTEPRAPVVTFLGHVDHGKTSLLDHIRNAAVAEKEDGGITQGFGSYRYDIKGKSVVFLDTPGHEAFTAMRARGADMTDIVVLVVAADDGVMPQTIEAISHAKAAEVPIVVALNKIDLPNANIQRAMGQLAEHDLQPREWGGQTEVIQTSATTGEGIDKLVEILTLEAELLELERVGIEADLIVCGAVPPRNVAHKRLKIIPYLDKNKPAQRKRLMRLIGSSDFLILPTRRDTFGHVFCEANAYGVPAIATDVGGVAEVIRNGVNGYTLPLSAGPADYAELIRDIYLDDERYRRLVRGSRDEFEQRLNWDVWGRGVAEYMRKVLPAELAAKVGPA